MPGTEKSKSTNIRVAFRNLEIITRRISCQHCHWGIGNKTGFKKMLIWIAILIDNLIKKIYASITWINIKIKSPAKMPKRRLYLLVKKGNPHRFKMWSLTPCFLKIFGSLLKSLTFILQQILPFWKRMSQTLILCFSHKLSIFSG